MSALLEGEDRRRLLETLGRFTRIDAAPFVAGPIVLPNATFFPDPWSPTEAGVEAIAGRLLAYAGLEGMTAEVTLEEHAHDTRSIFPETRLDLAGVEGTVAFFSVTRLGRADDATLALAQEVARAAWVVRTKGVLGETYRDSTRVALRQPDDEESELREDTSVLGAYLGLGVLGACGAHAFRQTSQWINLMPVTTSQTVGYGGISPEGASFLVAVQLVVRDLDGPERDEIVAALPEDRRAEVLAELSRLDREELLTTLGLGAPETWPAASAPVRPPAAPPRSKKIAATKKVGKATRVLYRSPGGGAIVGIGVATFAAIFVFPYIHGVGPLGIVGLFLGAGLGAYIGWHRTMWRCSACRAVVQLEEKRCPACRAKFVGREVLHAR